MTKPTKYPDFSAMPDDVLRAFARDLSNPKEAVPRIRNTKKQ